MADLYTDQMSSGVSGITTRARETTNQAKLKITVIDNSKIPYDESIKNVDRNLQNIIVETNDTLEKVRDEYQKRIDDQNCRSDLFWRVTGISSSSAGPPGGGGSNTQLSYTCTCVKLSPTYPKVENSGTMPYVGTGATDPSTGQLVLGDDGLPQGSYATGFSTSSMMWFKGSTGVGTGIQADIDTIDMGGNDPLVSAGSAFDTYLEPDNLHGLLLYREPYDRDVFDTYVSTGIGTISQGSTQLTLITPKTNLGIKPGMVVTPSELGAFPSSQGNIVISVGSTTMDLRRFSDVISVGTTSIYTVPVITLQDPAIANVLAPDSDDNYSYFDFSKDPDLISDEFAIDPKVSPYAPQTISLLGNSDLGTGVKIKYINNGASPASQEWNKFLEGLPNPDLLPDDIVDVTEPNVGAGKIYYAVGFDQKPILLGGADASEGDVRIFDGNIGLIQQAYTPLSGCNDSDLNSAISTRDDAESALSGSNSFPEKVTVVNSVRTKRNELNIAIWAYRTHIGNAENETSANNSFMNSMNTSPYKDLLNTGIE
jgi:hypothetical protein